MRPDLRSDDYKTTPMFQVVRFFVLFSLSLFLLLLAFNPLTRTSNVTGCFSAQVNVLTCDFRSFDKRADICTFFAPYAEDFAP